MATTPTQQSDCQLVTGVLKKLGGLSEDATSMLAASLPFALGEGAQKAEDRHSFQAQALEMIGEALTTGSRHADETKESQIRKAEELRAAVTSCKEKAAEARLAETKAKEAFAAKDAAYVETLKEAAAVEKLHKQAEVAQKTCDAARDAALQARDSTLAVQESTLSMLISGDWDKDTFEDYMGTVMKLIGECEIDACLVAGAAAAFAVKPDARGPFDKVIVDGVQAAVSKNLEQLSGAAAQRVAEAEELRAESLGLWAMLGEAQEAVLSATTEKCEAEKHWKQTSKAAQEAESLITTQEEEVLLCEVQQDTAAKMNESIAKAVEALGRLTAGDYRVPEPEAPAAPTAMEVETNVAASDSSVPQPMEVEEQPAAAETEKEAAAAAANKAEALTPGAATAVLEAAPSMGA